VFRGGLTGREERIGILLKARVGEVTRLEGHLSTISGSGRSILCGVNTRMRLGRSTHEYNYAGFCPVSP
jgi:hypothetical protein